MKTLENIYTKLNAIAYGDYLSTEEKETFLIRQLDKLVTKIKYGAGENTFTLSDSNRERAIKFIKGLLIVIWQLERNKNYGNQ